MLHNPDRKSSFLPTVLVAVACASVAAYFVFFRHKEAPPEPAVAAASLVTPASLAVPEEPPVPAFKPPKPEPPARPRVEPPAPIEVKTKVEAPPPRTEPVAGVAQVKFEAPRPSGEVDALLAEGRWREARAKLAPLFVAPCSDADRTSLSTKGLEISQQLLVLKPDEKDLELYEIQQGDTLEGIAKKFKTLNGVKGAVMLLNNYKENSVLRVGRKVKVPRGAWSIVVDKTLFKLWICYEGAPVKAYPVTIGAENKPTPAAKFVVGVRNPKPAWWPPAELNIKEAPIKYGDPRNPLGEWWVALDHDMHHGIGIHGTNEPQTIGTKASNGCVRMLNDDVCEVAAITYKGMVVTVVE